MISDAFVEVCCDDCGDNQQILLTAIARNGWDERNVKSELLRRGWKIDCERHICPDCMTDEGGPRR